jgi:uncharacterized protein
LLSVTEDPSLEARSEREHKIHHAVEHAAHLLPSQGPITVFVHHNTLHAYEDLSFDEGVKAGSRTFGCQPYLPEDRYRAYLEQGRIRQDDLSAVLIDDLDDSADYLIGALGWQNPTHCGISVEKSRTGSDSSSSRRLAAGSRIS